MRFNMEKDLPDDLQRQLRLRATVAWLEKIALWEQSPNPADPLWSFAMRRTARSRGFNPAAVLRELGHPEDAIQELLRHARTTEEWFTQHQAQDGNQTEATG